MSYVRWSTKVVRDCPTCGDVGWVALLPDHPDFLTWQPEVPEGVGPLDPAYPRMPHCCTSCWYIYDDVGGFLSVNHAGGHVCSGPNGETHEGASLYTVEEAREWEPPAWCRHRQVALDCVAEWIAEQES